MLTPQRRGITLESGQMSTDFKVNMLFLFKQNKAKKKKKGVVPGGGLKATMKDDLADYGGYDGEYVQDFEDFMWH